MKTKEIKKEQVNTQNVYNISLKQIVVNPENPRMRFLPEEDDELARSIHKEGLLHPISLNYKEDQSYVIICGERRFRAFKKLNLETIPAFIYSVSDEKALIMAITENLKRKNITPIEEALGYANFLHRGKHTIEDIALVFGQNALYIKTRLSLLKLIPEFQELVERNTITLSKALELSKYSSQVQHVVYTDCFNLSDENNWNNLTTAQFKSRMDSKFTTRLDQYAFDKTKCSVCPNNTANHVLFANDKEQICTNKECLERKRDEFVVGAVDHLIDSKTDMEICVNPFDKLPEVVQNELEAKGCHVKECLINDMPVKPEEPVESAYRSTEEYKKAKLCFEAEMDEYMMEVKPIKEKIDNGELKVAFYIGDNNPRLCYYEPTAPATDTKAQEEALRLTDKKIMDLSIKNTIRGAFKLFNSKPVDPGEINEYEEKLLTFLMLCELDPVIYPFVGISKTKLTEEEILNWYPKLTAEHRNKIKRYYLAGKLKNSDKLTIRTKLLVEYIGCSFPTEMEKIRITYENEYKRKSAPIQKELQSLITPPIPQSAAVEIQEEFEPEEAELEVIE